MPRPTLNLTPLTRVIPPRRGLAYVTLNEGDWDNFLAAAYDSDFVLLELDGNEHPTWAYRKSEVPAGLPHVGGAALLVTGG